MKKTLLQEVKAMNKIAGTELTKEQEIKLIRERLQQLNELEFGTQKAFDSYQKQHDMRGDTQVTVAGKKMSVNQAVKQSDDKALKGGPVFGNNKGGEVFGKKSNNIKTYKSLEKELPKTLEDMGYTSDYDSGNMKHTYTKDMGDRGQFEVTVTPSEKEEWNIRDKVKRSGKSPDNLGEYPDEFKSADVSVKVWPRKKKFFGGYSKELGGNATFMDNWGVYN